MRHADVHAAYHVDARRPQRERVPDQRADGQQRDDDVGAASRAVLVTSERMEHDDVALDREGDDRPHGEEAADVRHVNDQLTEYLSVEYVDAYPPEPDPETERDQEEVIYHVEESQIDARRLVFQMSANEDRERGRIPNQPDQNDDWHAERIHSLDDQLEDALFSYRQHTADGQIILVVIRWRCYICGVAFREVDLVHYDDVTSVIGSL